MSDSDSRPRYTTKRLRDEIEKARNYGLELAAAYHDDLLAQHGAGMEGDDTGYHKMMVKAHSRFAKDIRAIALKSHY